MVLFIKNTEQSVFDLDYEIKTFRNENNKITPEFAKNILSKTNHRANIRFIVRQIGLLDEEDRKSFGEFVVCAVDGRTHDDSTYKELRDLAIKCGCVEEFDSANEKRKLYGPEDCKGVVAHHLNQVQDCIDKGCITVLDIQGVAGNLIFKNADLSKVRLASLFLSENFGKVYYRTCYNYGKFNPSILSRANSYFGDCDLGGGENFYLSADNITLENTKNMSKTCVLTSKNFGNSCYGSSLCLINGADFTGCETFRGVGFIDFTVSKVSNVSGVVFINNNYKLQIGDSDFGNAKGLRIDNVERCYISSVKMPPIVYVDDVKEICFSAVDFENVESITFERVDKVVFGEKLPRKLDVSKVKEVGFGEDIASNVEEIVFRDIVQKNRALKGRKYSGEIKYTSLWGMGIGSREV